MSLMSMIGIANQLLRKTFSKFSTAGPASPLRRSFLASSFHYRYPQPSTMASPRPRAQIPYTYKLPVSPGHNIHRPSSPYSDPSQLGPKSKLLALGTSNYHSTSLRNSELHTFSPIHTSSTQLTLCEVVSNNPSVNRTGQCLPHFTSVCEQLLTPPRSASRRCCTHQRAYRSRKRTARQGTYRLRQSSYCKCFCHYITSSSTLC